jgi:hypothetical protein
MRHQQRDASQSKQSRRAGGGDKTQPEIISRRG